jgi:dienelactone hydrolase
MTNAIALLLLMSHLGIDPAFLSLSTPLEYRYTGAGYHDELFQYRLFCPGHLDPPDKRPLVVWLHGNCESNRDNIAHLKWLDQFIFQAPWENGRHPFFLLAVQCPRDNFAWTQRSGESQDDMVNVAAAILDQTIHDYPIDRERIYLAGVSSGGAGCWELAIRNPEYFAAVAPMGSDGGANSRVARLVNIPVWAFHSSRDSATPIDRVRNTVRALKLAGGNVHLTEIDSTKHDCWTAAFNDYHLLDWLLSQTRGQVSPAPGAIPLRTRMQDIAARWKWWQVLTQIGVAAVFIAATWEAVRRRQRLVRSRQKAAASAPA